MASRWIEALVIVAIVAATPFTATAGRKLARGRLGGAAMMIGLAFGALDPRLERSLEIIRKKNETPDAEASGAPPGDEGDMA